MVVTLLDLCYAWRLLDRLYSPPPLVGCVQQCPLVCTYNLSLPELEKDWRGGWKRGWRGGGIGAYHTAEDAYAAGYRCPLGSVSEEEGGVGWEHGC